MIGKLRGIYGGKAGDGVAVVDVQGVGYAVRTPIAFFALAQEGASLSLFIHTAVRDDAIDLYGFTTEEELAFFKQLMSVSSIGPKTALGILNVADVITLKRAIAQGDATMLTKVFGIGKKSAERIVVELRDKLAEERELLGESAEHESDAEVIEALIALGYSASESRKALKNVGQDMEGTRTRLAAALKNLGSRTHTQ